MFGARGDDHYSNRIERENLRDVGSEKTFVPDRSKLIQVQLGGRTRFGNILKI